MPGPTTEVLNDDLKGLRDDLHKVEVALREEIHRVDNGLTGLRAEVRNAIGIGKWVASIVVGLLLTGGVSGVWWASRLDADVKNLGARFDDRFKAVDARFDKLESSIEARFNKVDARFDKLEASITRALDQAKPAGATSPKSDPSEN